MILVVGVSAVCFAMRAFVAFPVAVSRVALAAATVTIWAVAAFAIALGLLGVSR